MPPPNDFDKPPPSRMGGLGPFFLPPRPPTPPAPEPSPEPVRVDKFQPAPTLQLRFDPRNPIRSDPSRRIESLGDIRDALIQDFVAKKLTYVDAGPKVVQLLGSFPGWLHPETPLSQWNTDQKPDFNVIGDAHTIIARLAPLMKWDVGTIRANLKRVEKGMVYFNLSLDTPRGPVPFKMGILDADLWRSGSHPYFDLRASLLEADGASYVYLSPKGTSPGMQPTPPLAAAEFQAWLRRVQAVYMGRSIETFLFSSGFSAQDLIERRYHNQFFNYELYRIFDWTKGKKQAARYSPRIPHILAPAVRDYLKTHPNLLEVNHPDHGRLAPEEISPENFLDLHFSWKKEFLQRVPHWWKSHAEFLRINGSMLQQTLRNIDSNRTSRPGHHKIGWGQYALRKFGRFFGIGPDLTPRDYSGRASFFPSPEARLGFRENPIDQMIILSGYPPEDERNSRVFEKMVEYVEAEISKGLKPNLMLYGNNPSKFTFPIRGVPMVAYRLMEALRSPVIKHVVVVGVPDVGVVTQAFQEHFAEEIQKKGMTIQFQDVGLEGGSYAKNIQRGLDHRPHPGKMTVLSPGDTPLVDPHNMAYHPWRHSLDYIIGANGRDTVLDFMGMNAHLQQDVEGVPFPFKEGNSQGVKKHVTEMVDEIYANRKSVTAGPWMKVWIPFKFALPRLFRPQLIDSLCVAVPEIGVIAGGNFIKRKLGMKAPKAGWGAEAVERATIGHFDWKLDLRSTHLDPGSLVDVDGVRDYALVELMAREMPPPYWPDLEAFAKTTLTKYRDQLPALENTPERINQIYRRIYEKILDREAERSAEERIHIDSDRLKRNGFNPESLPYLPSGELNPEWLKLSLPAEEMAAYRKSFAAYANRGEHAKNLLNGFLAELDRRRPWPPSPNDKLELAESSRNSRPIPGEKPLSDSKIQALQRFALRELALDPEYFRGLILEWDFDRVKDALMERARGKFGDLSQESCSIEDYFDLSTKKGFDTPLRRILLGMKAMDVQRRYLSHLSPEDFRALYPQLVEHVAEAQAVLAKHKFLSYKNYLQRGGYFFLQKFFDDGQVALDRAYLRKVGESPPAYRQRDLGRLLPHSNKGSPIQWDKNAEIRSAEAAPWLPGDIELFTRRLEILPDRIPDIMARAAGVESRSDLEKISQGRLTMERTLEWTQTAQGQEYLKSNEYYLGDTFKNRLGSYGPALAVGIGTLLGAERLADYLGLKATTNPHERFMFVVGASHLTSGVTQQILEAGRNALRGNPYHFVTTRAVHMGKAAAVAYRFHAADTRWGGFWDSLTRNYSLNGGVPRAMWNGAKGVVTLPLRASWNMGSGLMSAALTDRVLSQGMLGLEHDSSLRQKIHFGSFFLPDVARIAMGNKSPILFRNSITRAAGRAFAAGFIADLAFSAQQRTVYGSKGATEKGMVYQRANELNDADRGKGIVDGAFDMVAPQLAAWWDSVEFEGLKARPNVYQRMAAREMETYSGQVK